MKTVPTLQAVSDDGPAARPALSAELQLAFTDVAELAREGLPAMSVGNGLRVMAEMMEAEVTDRAGPEHARIPDRTASRYASASGSVVLGGRRVPISRPRAARLRPPPANPTSRPGPPAGSGPLPPDPRRGPPPAPRRPAVPTAAGPPPNATPGTSPPACDATPTRSCASSTTPVGRSTTTRPNGTPHDHGTSALSRSTKRSQAASAASPTPTPTPPPATTLTPPANTTTTGSTPFDNSSQPASRSHPNQPDLNSYDYSTERLP